jgi:hypothetical protein
MTEMTYQVEMSADTHNQLEKPGLTYRGRAEAVQAIRRVLEAHGRSFTIDQDGEVITFLNATGGALAVIKPVRAVGQGAT